MSEMEVNPLLNNVDYCSSQSVFPRPFSQVLYDEHESGIDWTSPHSGYHSFPAARDHGAFSWFDGNVHHQMIGNDKFIAAGCVEGRYYIPNQVNLFFQFAKFASIETLKYFVWCDTD